MMRYIARPYILIIALLSMGSVLQAAPRYARVVVGTKEAALSPKAVVEGSTVYAPASILKILGANYALGERKVTVALDEGAIELDVTEREQVKMVRLDRVAKALNLAYSWDNSTSTATLLSKLISVEIENSVLIAKLTAPVTVSAARIWPPDGSAGWRIQIDLEGSRLATGSKAYSVSGPDISQIRLGQFTDTTSRIVLDVGRKMGYQVLTTGASKEIRVSLGGATTHAIKPKDTQTPEVVIPSVTVTGISAKAESNDRVRIKVATTGKPTVKSRLLPSPPRIVLDIENATIGFRESVRVNHPLIAEVRYSGTQKTATVVCELTRYASFGVESNSTGITITAGLPSGAGGRLADKTIVVDAGHGGWDPGAQAAGVKEKDLNLLFAARVRAALEEAGAKVILTREDDVYVELPARPATADKNNADFFISIHCNAIGPELLSGIETFYHPGQPSSRALAYIIQDQLIKKTGMKDLGAKLDTRGNPKSIGFSVLRNANVPAILIETGFIDCTKDRNKLCDDDYRATVADAIVDGLLAYVEGRTQQEVN